MTDAAGPADPVRAILAGRLEAARHDAIRYALLTVLLTPGLLLLGGALVAFGLASIKATPTLFNFARLLPGMTGALGFMVLAYGFELARTSRAAPGAVRWGLVGGVIYAVQVIVVATTTTQGVAFGAIWCGLAVMVLMALGRAYNARETYRGWYDDAWLSPGHWLAGDLERAHRSLGFAIAGVELVIGAWGAMFGGVWRAFDDREVAVASEVLRASVAGDAPGARRALQRASGEDRVHVMRALGALELIKPGPALEATLAGKELVASATRR